jgi:hypothetical protein
VRTGVTWRDVQHDLTSVGHDRAQRDVLRAVLAMHTANARGYVGYGYDIAIHLDDIGPGLWQLLAQAEACGLLLVSSKASPGAVAVAEPLGVALDVRRTGPSGATLRPVVAAGERTLDARDVELIGNPAHGLFVTDPARIDDLTGTTSYDGSARAGLVLARLEPRPDEQVSALLREGRALEIPEGELSRFLSGYYRRCDRWSPSFRRTAAWFCPRCCPRG